jgi:hypothetical protein
MHCWVVDVRRVVAHSNSKGHAPLPGMVRTAVLCSGKQATSAVSLSGCTWTNIRPETGTGGGLHMWGQAWRRLDFHVKSRKQLPCIPGKHGFHKRSRFSTKQRCCETNCLKSAPHPGASYGFTKCSPFLHFAPAVRRSTTPRCGRSRNIHS